mmetsp:Transcript_5127/g.18758  ORF Transcript_5127/g.18758 Transcript_5127/m.18758 type:complete len:137 (-) Transcript_5127:1899-2309(-)|eukprot:scaffold3551_cov408-Prasinococcus_capsulatus_cf.AAC.15
MEPSSEILVARARTYAKQSNAHDLEGIAATLSDDPCLYGQLGVEAIMAFMREFRLTYPKVYWKFLSFEAQGEREVVMRFERYWTRAVDQQVCVVTATETLEFTAEGRLHRIGCCRQVSGPTPVDSYPLGATPAAFP